VGIALCRAPSKYIKLLPPPRPLLLKLIWLLKEPRLYQYKVSALQNAVPRFRVYGLKIFRKFLAVLSG